MSLTGWLQNVVSYIDNKDAGKCPMCGSTKVKVEEYTHGMRRSITFSCEECGQWDHFDGAKPKESFCRNDGRTIEGDRTDGQLIQQGNDLR